MLKKKPFKQTSHIRNTSQNNKVYYDKSTGSSTVMRNDVFPLRSETRTPHSPRLTQYYIASLSIATKEEKGGQTGGEVVTVHMSADDGFVQRKPKSLPPGAGGGVGKNTL